MLERRQQVPRRLSHELTDLMRRHLETHEKQGGTGKKPEGNFPSPSRRARIPWRRGSHAKETRDRKRAERQENSFHAQHVPGQRNLPAPTSRGQQQDPSAGRRAPAPPGARFPRPRRAIPGARHSSPGTVRVRPSPASLLRTPSRKTYSPIKYLYCLIHLTPLIDIQVAALTE